MTDIGKIKRRQARQQQVYITPPPNQAPIDGITDTANNVVNILAGLLHQDVGPIVTGSTAFIPAGNLRVGVQQLLTQLSPGLQTILFGGLNTRSQPESAAPQQAQPTQQAQEIIAPSEPIQVTEETTPPAQTTTTTTTVPITTPNYLKAVDEETTTKKEYIYLVLRPDEYDELVKYTQRFKNETRYGMEHVETTTSTTTTTTTLPPSLFLTDPEKVANFYLTHKNSSLTYYKPKLPTRVQNDFPSSAPLTIKDNTEDDEEESNNGGRILLKIKTYQDVLNNSLLK